MITIKDRKKVTTITTGRLYENEGHTDFGDYQISYAFNEDNTYKLEYLKQSVDHSHFNNYITVIVSPPQCNRACWYCVANEVLKSSKDIPYTQPKELDLILYRLSTLHLKINLVFTIKEPLAIINEEWVKEIIKVLKKNQSSILSIGINTNGFDILKNKYKSPLLDYLTTLSPEAYTICLAVDTLDQNAHVNIAQSEEVILFLKDTYPTLSISILMLFDGRKFNPIPPDSFINLLDKYKIKIRPTFLYGVPIVEDEALKTIYAWTDKLKSLRFWNMDRFNGFLDRVLFIFGYQVSNTSIYSLGNNLIRGHNTLKEISLDVDDLSLRQFIESDFQAELTRIKNTDMLYKECYKCLGLGCCSILSNAHNHYILPEDKILSSICLVDIYVDLFLVSIAYKSGVLTRIIKENDLRITDTYLHWRGA